MANICKSKKLHTKIQKNEKGLQKLYAKLNATQKLLYRIDAVV